MRKENTTRRVATLRDEEGLRSYHGYAGSHNTSNNYAYNGFKNGMQLFTSDRVEKLEEHAGKLLKADGKAPKSWGFEEEMVCNNIDGSERLTYIVKNMCHSKLPNNFYKYESDSSLRGDSSCEAITNCFTKEFLRNHYPEYKSIYADYKVLGITKNNSCGMHINIGLQNFGREWDKQIDTIRKLHYFINNNFAFSCKLVKRDIDCVTYCRSYGSISKETAKTIDLTQYGNSHGVCINYGHLKEGRLELRLVGGTTTFGAFRNTMEVAFFLVANLQKVSWAKMDDLVEIFKGCNQYVYDRLCDCGLSQAQLEEIKAHVVEENLI